MASLQSVYGGAEQHFGSDMSNPFSSFSSTDSTPQTVALMLLFWGGVLWLLKKNGFRFNFGVAGGR